MRAVPALLLGVLGVRLAAGHPMRPTCFGFCMVDPGASGKRRGSSLSKTLAVRVSLPGCSSKPCWLQHIRVGVDETNSVASAAKAGLYLSDGRLVAASEVYQVPTSLPDHTWLTFPFRGHGLEVKTLSEQDDVWLVVSTEESVQLTYENVGSAEEAARYVSEPWPEALAPQQDWQAAPSRQWAGHFRKLRMQVELGDVSVLPGTLPLVLEAPHGGRIVEGWPQRASGVLSSDQNTDLFTEALWGQLRDRCGRSPTAVILRVDRQGIDANRATGNGSLTREGGHLCAEQSNGECCCDLPNLGDSEVAMDLNDVYHSVLAAQLQQASGALLVPIHATGRHRVEVGARLSAERLNQAAALDPPSLSAHDSKSSLRALGEATDLIWGPNSLGALLKAKRPGMEVIPSPEPRCPDPNICPGSSYSQLFMGGHNLKIHVNDTQPGVQLELPQVMRGFGSSPPAVEPAAARQVAAALASFLNTYYQVTCVADVNFGLTCEHGQALQGACVCDAGYAGVSCADCSEGYHRVDGHCMRLVIISPPSGVTQKWGSAFPTTSSGKRYLYTRKFSTDLSDCGAGCQPVSLSLLVRCDSDQCHSDLDSASYTVGVAVYNAAGARLCNGTLERSAQAETDWWLAVPLPSCPLLHQNQQEHGAVYLAMWTSKKIKLRWEQEPSPGRSRGLQYRTEQYQEDPGAQSSENLVDALPPGQLPSWVDTTCVSPTGCQGADDGCDCISGCTCRSWTLSGIRNYYGLMATLSMQPA